MDFNDRRAMHGRKTVTGVGELVKHLNNFDENLMFMVKEGLKVLNRIPDGLENCVFDVVVIYDGASKRNMSISP